jgi:uncharacterized membrane protein
MKKYLIGFLLIGLLAIAFATQSTVLTSLNKAVLDLCQGLKTILPIAIMLMIIFAGVVYAAGQMMGAETRARATVWATAALTGALIGVLIYAIAPAVLTTIYGTNSLQNVC